MADEEHVHDDKCLRFQWKGPEGKDGSKDLHIVAWLGDARLHVDFNDDAGEGTREFTSLILAIPSILSHVRNEVMVKREVDSVDQDLLDLLGEDEV